MTNRELKTIIRGLERYSCKEEAKLWQDFFKNTGQADKFTVVNAGLVNGGKSSLFNALADQDGLFPTGDIPTTIVRQSVEMGSGICLLDSPGLDVRDADTQEALRAYREADLILVIHNLNTGEYDRKEIEFILLLKEMFPNDQNLARRIVFVGSRTDLKENSGGCRAILTVMKRQLKEYCGFDDADIIPVSAKVYLHGLHTNHKLFMEASGIQYLRDLITQRAVELSIYKKNLEKRRFDNLRDATVMKLDMLAEEKRQFIDRKKNDSKNRKKQLLCEWDNLKANIRKKWKPCATLFKEI